MNLARANPSSPTLRSMSVNPSLPSGSVSLADTSNGPNSGIYVILYRFTISGMDRPFPVTVISRPLPFKRSVITPVNLARANPSSPTLRSMSVNPSLSSGSLSLADTSNGPNSGIYVILNSFTISGMDRPFPVTLRFRPLTCMGSFAAPSITTVEPSILDVSLTGHASSGSVNADHEPKVALTLKGLLLYPPLSFNATGPSGCAEAVALSRVTA